MSTQSAGLIPLEILGGTEGIGNMLKGRGTWEGQLPSQHVSRIGGLCLREDTATKVEQRTCENRERKEVSFHSIAQALPSSHL